MRLEGYRMLLLAASLCACGRASPLGESRPLVDGIHQPLILTESAQLAMPPDYSGNRFVSGWWPERRGGSLRQISVSDRPMLEAVFLDGRERRLNTRLEIVEAAPDAMVGVRVAGVELPPLPLVKDLEVPLPGRLPPGRLPIELALGGARVVIRAVGFGHAWPPGEVDLEPGAILQAGYSAIDFPRRLAASATLVGRFEPPAEAEPHQRFAVLVETDAGGSEVGFEWRAGGRRGEVAIEEPLPAGFVRIRLLAQGLGPAGRWRQLGLLGGDTEAAEELIDLRTAAGRHGIIYVAASERYQLIRAPRLGLAGEAEPTRDAEYVFDLRQAPGERRNLAGTRMVEVDWLRARLAAWIATAPEVSRPVGRPDRRQRRPAGA
jgi:hypothetical protein